MCTAQPYGVELGSDVTQAVFVALEYFDINATISTMNFTLKVSEQM